MIRKITTHKRIAVASVLAISVVVTALALAFTIDTGPNLPDPLPPMTLTYEVYGPSIGVGSRSIPAFKEIRRLEYRSQTDWRETVIESPTLDLGRYGTGSKVGSYRQVKGNVETDYDAMTDSTVTTSLEQGIHIPQDALAHAYTPVGYSPIRGGVAEAIAIDASLSVGGNPVQDPQGVKYTNGSREVIVFEGDGFIIPLKDGDNFILKSAVIHGP